MSTYLYSGPTTGLTLRAPDGSPVEKMLFHGTQVELPDCDAVHTLIALKRLSLQADAPAAAPAPAPAIVQPGTPEVQADAVPPTTASTATKKGA